MANLISSPTDLQYRDVVIGIASNSDNQILIAKRPDSASLGGLWEFPGGKVEVGESLFQALQREFSEEVALQVISATPILCIQHRYTDISVRLHVFQITAFLGQARGNESQFVQWVDRNALSKYTFPEANQVILDWLNLAFDLLIC